VESPLLVAKFSPQDFLTAFNTEIKLGGMLVRGVVLTSAEAMAECRVQFDVSGYAPLTVDARVAAVLEDTGTAVVFLTQPMPLHALAESLTRMAARPAAAPVAAPVEAASPLAGLSQDEKKRQATSGNRDVRRALLAEGNPALQLLVLSSKTLGMDEVQVAARLPNLGFDAMKLIAEHPEWRKNAGVTAALLLNPSTPMSIALPLVELLPANELRNIARNSAYRAQICDAAKSRLAR